MTMSPLVPCTVADLHSKILDAHPSPGVQILSISCSFWEILTKSYVGAPPGELVPPPRGNPGSATDVVLKGLSNGTVLAIRLNRPVGDPGFSRGGGTNSKGGCENYYLVNFSQKLHEIERICTPRGGRRPWRPLRSANVDL